MFIIANIDDGYDKEILNAFKNTLSENQKCIVIDTKIEQEISQLSPEEQFEFLKELEISDTALNQIIQTGYQLLGLKTFLHQVKKKQEHGQQKKNLMQANVQVLYILILKEASLEQKPYLIMII